MAILVQNPFLNPKGWYLWITLSWQSRSLCSGDNEELVLCYHWQYLRGVLPVNPEMPVLVVWSTANHKSVLQKDLFHHVTHVLLQVFASVLPHSKRKAIRRFPMFSAQHLE